MKRSTSERDPSRWLEKYGDSLYRFALARLRDPHAAEEAVQETFLGAIRNVQQFKGQGAEGAWLMGILKRKVIDRIRANVKNAERFDDDEDLMAHLFDARGHWTAAARASSFRLDSIEQSEFREIFEHCLEHLPNHQASVFVLREIEEHPSEKICKVLGISATNLWVLMHRARLRLAECIKARWAMEDA